MNPNRKQHPQQRNKSYSSRKPVSKTPDKTSWESVEKWYRGIVGEEGHYYHQSLILPHLANLLKLQKDSRVLDVACGNGILGRNIPEKISYLGIDIAPSFVKEAENLDKSPIHRYKTGDATKPLPIDNETFTHATLILAIQNIEFPEKAFKNVAKHLEKGSLFIIVMNHPCFRIPRQTSWQIDEAKKMQYRRIDRYFTAMQIPIQAHPSQGISSVSTISFHHPISAYVTWLKNAGFYVQDMQEWCSDKISTGKAAKMENRARDEFPLFLTIIAEKK